MVKKKADLSEWQYGVNFTLVKPEVDFVTLRVQAGSSHPDARYAEYVAGCAANGIPFGTYAYEKFVSVPDAIVESDNMYTRSDKRSIYYVLDAEDVFTKNPADFVPACQAFIDNLKKKGVQKVGLYTYESFYNEHGMSAIKADFKWIAKYPYKDNGTINPASKPSIASHMWQYTQCGHLPGISTNVDLSELVGDLPLEYFTGQSAPAPKADPIAPVFCTKQVILQTVRALVPTDIRVAPNHASAFVRDAVVGEVFHVFDRVGDWHNVGGANWIDGNNGANLFWIRENRSAPAPTYHIVVSGDTVGKLATANGTTQDQIKAWNNLSDVNNIYIGQRLRVK